VTDPAEAAVLNELELCLVAPHEQEQWERLMQEHHYLQSGRMVGEQLRYVAKYRGRWMALLGWSAAAYHLKGREGWIGWDPNQRAARLHLVDAARGLRARQLPAAWEAQERPIARRCALAQEQLRSLWTVLHQQVPESRDLRGLRHRQATVLAITFAFLWSGGQGGHRAVALFAEDLSPRQRANLRCWFNPRTRTYDVPSENCFYRVLKAVPVLAFQQALWAWQKARHGAEDGGVVVLDGKALRGSGKTQLVGAIAAGSGRTLAVEPVAQKSNEIPAAQTLLERLDLEGTIALLDGMHTQVETARSIVQEGGGDYVLFVKGNQQTLQNRARHFLPEDFSPSIPDGEQRPRADRVAGHRGEGSEPRPDGLCARRPGGSG